MMKKSVAAAAAISTYLVAFSAAADPAFTANKPQLGLNLGYGVFMGDDEGDPPNPYNIGLNARGGYTLDFGLYVGANVDYFFGSTQEVTLLGTTVESTTNIYQLGVELGYDLGVSPTFVLRPKVGLNYATVASELEVGGSSTSADESAVAFAPGLQALIALDKVFLSADVRYNIFSIEPEEAEGSTDTSGLLFGVGAGLTF